MHRNKFDNKLQLTVTNKAWKPISIGIIVGGLLAGVAFASILSLYLADQTKESSLGTVTVTTAPTTTATTTTSITSTTTTTSTTTATTTSTTSTTTTSTTSTTTTTTAPASSICVSNISVSLYNNQFVYSPTSQIYAAGMLNNQFGVYIAYGYANVSSTALWTAAQSSTSQTCFLALQTDRHLVVYTLTSVVLWASGTNNGGIGSPFCFQMLDSGNLIWTDNTNTIVWQTNTVQTG
ncbi:unnamed protein product [Rotaria magnacalcarata]|uniref:Bulb-type lectin domain-containing protein n=1 Tax=Rotaria magnacalcarata TaxID=392030 RepID=A0A816QWE1_9BILA|nr:unnamed protein product [Rotaria magnacalcarata]CAF3814710.1 unnamed protein product [Rotaria magnacalcarata]